MGLWRKNMISKIVKVRTHDHLFYGDTGIRTLLTGWELGDCREVGHKNGQNPKASSVLRISVETVTV